MTILAKIPLVKLIQQFVFGFAVIALFGSASYAGPWSRATGEAVELQRSTKDLRNRMSRLFATCPATPYAIAVDEQALHLIQLTKSQVPSYVLDECLTNLNSLIEQTRLLIAADTHVANDRNVSRYSTSIGQRFERAVKDLQRAVKPQVTAPVIHLPVALPITAQLPSVQYRPIYGSPIQPNAVPYPTAPIEQPCCGSFLKSPIESATTLPATVAAPEFQESPQITIELPRISL
jgi:hypothetical protein